MLEGPLHRTDPRQLRIVHCVRAPIGGIFRNVLDLAAAQTASGHLVGIVLDSLTGGDFEASKIAAARPLPMPSSFAPPPVTVATFPLRPHSSLGVIACLSMQAERATWSHSVLCVTVSDHERGHRENVKPPSISFAAADTWLVSTIMDSLRPYPTSIFEPLRRRSRVSFHR